MRAPERVARVEQINVDPLPSALRGSKNGVRLQRWWQRYRICSQAPTWLSHIYALDEGSSAAFDLNSIALPVNTCVVAIGVIRLAVNLGHQGAIAA